MEIRSALKRLVVTRRLGEGSSSSLGPFSGHSVSQDKISGLNAAGDGYCASYASMASSAPYLLSSVLPYGIDRGPGTGATPQIADAHGGRGGVGRRTSLP